MLQPKQNTTISVQSPTLSPDSLGATAGAVAIMTVFPTTPTPTQTTTPIPTTTPTKDLFNNNWMPINTPSVLQEAQLSFYDPYIGAYFPDIKYVNCRVWDDLINDCISRVNGGADTYHQWYRKGFACPVWMDLGTVIEVFEPVQLAGRWRCIDRGDGIVGSLFDFMLKYPDDIWTGQNINDFPWRSRVLYQVVTP